MKEIRGGGDRIPGLCAVEVIEELEKAGKLDGNNDLTLIS